jgi:hypothetical protein
MSLSTTMKDYYASQGINYDKATERLLKGRDNRPTVKAIPVVLAVLVETSVKADSIAPLLKGE